MASKHTSTLVLASLFVLPGLLFAKPPLKPISLADQLSSLNSTLQKAEHCVPTVSKGRYDFCSGFFLTAEEATKLWQKDIGLCKSAILAAGYKVTSDNSEGSVAASAWSEFINSTQAALTFHDEKTVGFKEMSIVNCMHEFIHVLQATRAKDSVLAPASREAQAREIETQLQAPLAQVEKLEKAGRRKQAQAEADRVQPVITKLKELHDLSQSFDEVEAHFFIYNECKTRACTADDKVTALVNLYNRKEFLSGGLKSEVVEKVQAMIAERRQVAIANAQRTWKKSDDKALRTLVQRWFALEDSALIDAVKAEGFAVKRLKASKAPPFVMGAALSEKATKSLAEASAGELAVLDNSKLVVGEALGKFVCKQNGVDGDVIVVTQYASKGTLIHEALHGLQKKANSGYCDAVFKQTDVAAEFKRGAIPREEHDAKILYYQAINALAEREVYAMMLNFKAEQSEIENLNNAEFFRHYGEWLGAAPGGAGAAGAGAAGAGAGAGG
jgi:hypothetical protein